MNSFSAVIKNCKLIFYVLVFLILVGCTFVNSRFTPTPQATSTNLPSRTPTQITLESPIASAPSSATATLAIPEFVRQIWFAPLPPMPQNAGRPYIGSEDFMELFQSTAAWEQAAQRVDVFKLYGEWVAYHATDQELEQVVKELKRREIALAVEAGPLNPSEDCGGGVEGFAGLEEGRLIADRLFIAGGIPEYIALDEPYFFAHLYDGPGACHWDIEQIARGVADYITVMREAFPEVIVGDTEPLPRGVDPQEYKLWLETYRQVAGADLDFIHLDMDYQRMDWPLAVFDLEEFARSRGIQFGIIYMGDDQSDEMWISTAWYRAGIYEAYTGGLPDHVLFQSWNDHPDRTLPESDPNSFTHLINRYFRKRSILRADIGVPDEDGNLLLSGSLTGVDAQPITSITVDAHVSLQYFPSVLDPPQMETFSQFTGAGGAFKILLEGLPPFGSHIQVRYTGSDNSNPDGSAGFWPAYYDLTYGPPGRNVARDMPAVASIRMEGSPAGLAVDGNPETVWSAGEGPRHFIQIDLEEATSVVLLRLLVSQYPAGKTIHWIWGVNSAGEFRLLREVGGETIDGDIIDVWPEEPWDDIVSIRIETVQSPSWVAWREIEIVAP